MVTRLFTKKQLMDLVFSGAKGKKKNRPRSALPSHKNQIQQSSYSLLTKRNKNYPHGTQFRWTSKQIKQ